MTMHAAIVPLYALALAAPFASKDTARPQLQHIQIRKSPQDSGRLLLTATDMHHVIRVRFHDPYGTSSGCPQEDYPAEGISLARTDALELLKETRDHNAVVQAPALARFPAVANAACAISPNSSGAATSISTATLELLTKAVKGCLKHAQRTFGKAEWAHWRAETIGDHVLFSLDTNIPGLEAAVLASGMRSEKAERNTPVVPAAIALLKE